MIRAAEDADFPEVLRMARAFHAVSALKFQLEEAALERLFVALRSGGNKLLVAQGQLGLIGMLGIMCYPHPLNSQIVVAQELMWWAEPGESAGIRLLDAGEKFAAESGCRLIQMGALQDLQGERVAHLYQHRGYVPFEQSFVRYLC